jgi:head-tail adaptor
VLVCEQEMKKRDQRRDEIFFFSSLWARINGGEKRERYAPPPKTSKRKIKIIRYAFSVFT